MVELTAFKSKDGKFFESKEECLLHEFAIEYGHLTSGSYALSHDMPDFKEFDYFIGANLGFIKRFIEFKQEEEHGL